MDSCRTFVVITLFPEPVLGVLNSSILKKAQDKGLVRFIVLNLRDFGNGRYRSTDDYPYGGGGGMILRPEPVFRALQFAQTLLGVPPEGTQKQVPLPPEDCLPDSAGTGFSSEGCMGLVS